MADFMLVEALVTNVGWDFHGKIMEISSLIYHDICHDILNMILMGVSVMRSPKNLPRRLRFVGWKNWCNLFN